MTTGDGLRSKDPVGAVAATGAVWTAGLALASFLPVTLVLQDWYVAVPILGVVPVAFVRVARQRRTRIAPHDHRAKVLLGLAITVALLCVVTGSYVESYRVTIENGSPLLLYRGNVVRHIGWEEFRYYSNGLVRFMAGVAFPLFTFFYLVVPDNSK